MAGLVNVVHHDGAAHFARVIHNQVTKSQQALRNAGRNGHILNLAEWDVTSGSRHQAGVDLHLGVGQGVANHVALEMEVSGNQK